MLTNLTGKVEEGKVLHPVVVVNHDSSIRLLRLEIEELGHLFLDALLIVAQGLIVEQITLLALTRRVADHTCSTTHENDGSVTTTLQVTEHHDTTEVADMQGVCRGVGT